MLMDMIFENSSKLIRTEEACKGECFLTIHMLKDQLSVNLISRSGGYMDMCICRTWRGNTLYSRLLPKAFLEIFPTH